MLFILQACKHPLAIEGEGDIVDLNGNGFGCTLEQFQSDDPACQNDVIGDYYANYSAVPRPGWVFSHWDGSCGHLTEEPQCRFDVGSFFVSFWDLTYGAIPIPTLTAVFVTEEQAAINDLYVAEVAAPVVEAQCMACHVEGGRSGYTRLVFDHEFSDEQNQNNIDALSNFVATVEDGGDYLLTKVRGGAGHGGGSIFSTASDEFISLDALVSLLNGEELPGTPTESNLFWADVELADSNRTLRRAAIIVSGRLPTGDELEQASSGDEGLEASLLSLMEGEGFHNFIVNGTNDRLHTFGATAIFVLPGTANFAAWNNYLLDIYEGEGESSAWAEVGKASFGLSRSPSELVAYVVENDLPYTEILTADYAMMNPAYAAFNGADLDFQNPDSILDFLPGQTTQVLRDDNLINEEIGSEFRRFSGNWTTVTIPHAGILTSYAFLDRYETTETNRNRARSRWTYLHFLGVDIEKSAGRTNDPDALADTDNPTMNNPNCTVCHTFMDPVAGTFQNFGNQGIFREAYGGLDALPSVYKEAGSSFGSSDSRIVFVYDGSDGVARVAWDAFENGDFSDANLGDCCPEVDGLGTDLTLSLTAVDARIYAYQDGELINEGLVPPGYDVLLEAGGVALFTWYEDTTKTFDTIRIWDESGSRPVLVYEDDFSEVDPDVWIEVYGAWSSGDGVYSVQGDGLSVLSLDALGIDPLKDLTIELEVLDSTPGIGIWFRSLPLLDVAIYREGDTWFRDMRLPGFEGKEAPSNENSLQWLAQEIVNDPRFALATVLFWWEAVMGVPPLEAPELLQDGNYTIKLEAYEAQQSDMKALATSFRDSYSLKELLAEMMLSPWFRAEFTPDMSESRKIQLATAGVERLLTPEQIEQKLYALAGYQINPREVFESGDYFITTLSEEYRQFLGGIDSVAVRERATVSSSVITQTLEAMALSAACGIVAADYHRESVDRVLFGGIDMSFDIPGPGDDHITDTIQNLHSILLGEELTDGSVEVEAARQLLTEVRNYHFAENFEVDLGRDSSHSCWYPSGTPENIPDPEHMLKAWSAVIAYLLMDYRFAHE